MEIETHKHFLPCCISRKSKDLVSFPFVPTMLYLYRAPQQVLSKFCEWCNEDWSSFLVLHVYHSVPPRHLVPQYFLWEWQSSGSPSDRIANDRDWNWTLIFLAGVPSVYITRASGVGMSSLASEAHHLSPVHQLSWQITMQSRQGCTQGGYTMKMIRNAQWHPSTSGLPLGSCHKI